MRTVMNMLRGKIRKSRWRLELATDWDSVVVALTQRNEWRDNARQLKLDDGSHDNGVDPVARRRPGYDWTLASQS